LTNAADHLSAALANFSFHTLISGCVSGNSINIDSVAAYVRDSYDFNGDQKKFGVFDPGLGVWDFDDMEFDGVGEFFAGSGYGTAVRIRNEHFRHWRSFIGNGKGGDYIIYSDLKVTRLKEPVVVSK
jgi:hypothetical protein